MKLTEPKIAKAAQKKFKTPIAHIDRFVTKCIDDNLAAMAGQSAFFIILSAIPFLLFAFSIFSIFVGGDLKSILPDETQYTGFLSVVGRYVNEAYQHASGTAIITIIIALWSAGKGMYNVTDGISRIYKLPQKHTWLARRIFAMGYTIVLFLIMALSLGMMVLNVVVETYIKKVVSVIPMGAAIVYGLRYIIVAIFLTLVLTVILKIYLFNKVDDKRYANFRVLLPGMAFTSVAWMVVIRGIEFYTVHFSSSIYGSLGTVIIIMMWVYISMYILLLGVEMNYIYRDAFYRFSFKKAYCSIKAKIKRKKEEKAKNKTASS